MELMGENLDELLRLHEQLLPVAVRNKYDQHYQDPALLLLTVQRLTGVPVHLHMYDQGAAPGAQGAVSTP
jgi:hypothetical protein